MNISDWSQSLEKVTDRDHQTRVQKIRRNIVERNKNKRALMQSWMGHHEVWQVKHRVIVDKEIEIKGTRCVRKGPHPAEITLNLEKVGYQLVRPERGCQTEGSVQKRGLIEEAHWCSFIDLRGRLHDSKFFNAKPRLSQCWQPLAEVRAKANVRGA